MTKPLSTLPPMPARVRALPVDARGYPVPWFVAWLDAEGRATQRGRGTPDFRVASPVAKMTAITSNLCWICGQKRTALSAFLIGPMCAINRVSSEPPSHITCADFAARACPFLVKPSMRRREANMPEGWVDPAGVMVTRNPGVALLWATTTFTLFDDGSGGTLFELGEPERVCWYAEGRIATRAEVNHSIRTGLPLLASEAQGPVELMELQAATERSLKYLPTETNDGP